MIHNLSRYVCAIALASAPLLAGAAGALEINQDCAAVGCFSGDVAGFPVEITQPGSYVLTSDLVLSNNVAQYAIYVGADSVDLDLNGHVIRGDGSCSGSPVTACSGATVDYGILANGIVHLHNGSISGFTYDGVALNSVVDGFEVDHVIVQQNGDAGMRVQALDQTSFPTIRVHDAQFSRNGVRGIDASASYPARISIGNSIIAGNAEYGVYLPSGGVLTGNRINDNGQLGIYCVAECALGQNTLQNNNGGGSNSQWYVSTLRDMGGNVCLDDGTCP